MLKPYSGLWKLGTVVASEHIGRIPNDLGRTVTDDCNNFPILLLSSQHLMKMGSLKMYICFCLLTHVVSRKHLIIISFQHLFIFSILVNSSILFFILCSIDRKFSASIVLDYLNLYMFAEFKL